MISWRVCRVLLSRHTCQGCGCGMCTPASRMCTPLPASRSGARMLCPRKYSGLSVLKVVSKNGYYCFLLKEKQR
ncbi:hypothetical protein I79_003684 [Cricetulus griseus]|uniref:Uncharacterized protein n=1 Tax=Cricetulus griseus TaxID=10029 RepID=G3H0M1_CRIGR|nr:hypothetical protein I79_003684 [Cricetulus griseus]